MIKQFTLILFVLLIVAIQLTLTACDSAQSRAKKIVSLRSERKQILDTLYRSYGGSELSQSVKSGIQNGKESGSNAENHIVQGLANLAQGADRSIFEQSIQTIGNGQNPIVVTDKAKQFFSRGDVLKRAKRICEIDIELDQLEKKVN